MYLTRRRPIAVQSLVLLLSLALSSCGPGTSTVGVGGSGIGGTGITTVAGNVAQVVARAPARENLFARLLDLVSAPVNAQSGLLAGIRVSGGGQSTVTDGAGRFNLPNVTPSISFVLTFTTPDGQSLPLPIGTVPPGSLVRVNDVVLNTGQGTATAGNIEVEEDDDSDDESRDDDDSDSLDNDDSLDDDESDVDSSDILDDDDSTGG